MDVDRGSLQANSVCLQYTVMHGSEWTLKYDDPQLKMSHESATFSTEGHHISMSHERPCFLCFVVWPTTR